MVVNPITIHQYIKKWITQVIGIHPLGTRNVCAENNAKSFRGCRYRSLKTNKSIFIVAEKKQAEDQSHLSYYDSSSGDAENVWIQDSPSNLSSRYLTLHQSTGPVIARNDCLFLCFTTTRTCCPVIIKPHKYPQPAEWVTLCYYSHLHKLHQQHTRTEDIYGWPQFLLHKVKVVCHTSEDEWNSALSAHDALSITLLVGLRETTCTVDKDENRHVLWSQNPIFSCWFYYVYLCIIIRAMPVWLQKKANTHTHTQ